MKVKLDFVTNSSSATFVFESSTKILRKDIEKHMRLYYAESFRCFNNKKSVISFTEAGYGDWVSKARGEPATFWNMGRPEYNAACEALREGNYCIYACVDRNDPDRLEKFQDLVENEGGRVKYRGGD
jgi:hypothetical protein